VIAGGAEPEFMRLTATFPGMRPLDVPPASITLRDDDLDVAVLKLDPLVLEGVPTLPLHAGPLESEDQRAIVVGYPTGLAALMARADPALADSLRERSATFADAIAALAAAGNISPLITQGVVSNVEPRMIVYDASTTHGGSGGPVFGGDGEVIAVNYAILPSFGGANFGVPIAWALELLPR
jgi:S1-C subfamily serine protease